MLLILGTVLFAVALLFAIDTLFRPAAERRASLERVVSYATAQQAARAARREATRVRRDRRARDEPHRAAADTQGAVRPAREPPRGCGCERFNVQQFLALKTLIAAFGIVLGLMLGRRVT